jgi:hypothetical protein
MMKFSRRAGRLPAVLSMVVLGAVMKAEQADAASTSSGASGSAAASAATGTGQLPISALQRQGMPSSGQYGLGAMPNRTLASVPQVTPDTLGFLPPSVDLSQFDPAVGNQGGVNSCTAWATGYYLHGWYAKRDGYYPGSDAAGTGSFAPMYTYSQLVAGQNTGTTIGANLNIQFQQGIDARANYSQGDYNYTSLPSRVEAINAAQDRLFGYNDVNTPGFLAGGLQNWIESSIAAGNPVVIGFPVYSTFKALNSSNYFYGSASGNYLGNHVAFAPKYDGNGLWIENSWGTGWGHNGYAELSWSFVDFFAFEAASILPVPMKTRFQGIPWDRRHVYVLGSNGNLWREAGNASSRTLVDGNVAQFQALDSTTVYVLGTDGKLWREIGSSSNRSQVDGNVLRFQALDSTTVYVLGTDGKLWRETGSSSNRTQVDASVAEFQALNGTTVYVRGTDGKLWRETGSSSNRSLVDSSVEQFQALDSTTVYVLGLDGKLWRETGNASNRSQVDASVEQFQALDGTTAYVLGADGKLWRETGSSSSRTQVDANVAEFQGLDATDVYVLGTDGNLWLEQGDWTNRSLVDSSV